MTDSLHTERAQLIEANRVCVLARSKRIKPIYEAVRHVREILSGHKIIIRFIFCVQLWAVYLCSSHAMLFIIWFTFR